jgi:hypothetical protein
MATPKITTVEEALATVREDGKALKDVPDKLKTAEVCLEAIKQQGKFELYTVPHGTMSDEVFAFNYVPANLWTAEMCLEALKLKAANISAFYQVPDNAKTAEACLEAVRQSGAMLKLVPEKLKTVELCLEAVKNLSAPPPFVEPNWDRFSNVPEDLREEVRRRYESGK